jgi:hypothetical protein
VCLNDWASHGLSWFECVFSASQEKKASRIFFTAGAALRDALAAVNQFCERELVHYIEGTRAERLQAELAAAQAGKEYVTPKGQVAELPGLLEELADVTLADLGPLLAFVREAHSILRSYYIFLCLQYTRFDLALHASKRSPNANTLLVDLNQVEYFTDALTSTLLPSANTPRVIRTLAVMQQTVGYVRKYTKQLAGTLTLFQRTDLKNQNDEKNTDAFFAALDEAYSK